MDRLSDVILLALITPEMLIAHQAKPQATAGRSTFVGYAFISGQWAAFYCGIFKAENKPISRLGRRREPLPI